jgi:hypothetical protein
LIQETRASEFTTHTMTEADKERNHLEILRCDKCLRHQSAKSHIDGRDRRSLPEKSLMSGEAHGVEAILKRAEILDRYGVKVEIEHVRLWF